MLLEFKVKNYKSFADEMRFSMVAAPKQKGLDYSLFPIKTKQKTVKALRTSVIYGPNASGKTNIIGAMDVMRSIVMRGNISNPKMQSSPNTSAYNLELIPNNTLTEPRPVAFSVEFFEKDMLIKYEISVDLGRFLDSNYARKITKERLVVNGIVVFARSENHIALGDLSVIKEYISDLMKKDGELNEESIRAIVKGCADNPEELFLTNGFKVVISSAFVKTVLHWFTDKFNTVYRADMIDVSRKVENTEPNSVFIDKSASDAAKLFGVCSNKLGYRVNENSYTELCSIIENTNTAMSAEVIESYGTIRFMNLLPLLTKAIKHGGVLVIDEFDASIHPMALMSIINIFHNDEINTKGAQLIFNTHNPIFLNSNLFRRDEIKFVERDDTTRFSRVYSLADFGTSGENGVRNGEDYMKNYFISQYGAINDVDFTPIFEQLLVSEEEV